MGSVTVVGAGLAGCMSALLLAKHNPNLKIVVVERRADERCKDSSNEEDERKRVFGGNLSNSSKRSINLALSYRGIQALKECDLWDVVRDGMIIEMKGRYVHQADKLISIQPYNDSADVEKKLYSVSRTDLNELLLNQMEQKKNISTIFGTKCVSVSATGDVNLKTDDNRIETLQSDYILGADGVYSSVRASMSRLGRFSFQSAYISHGYKELTIMPSEKGDFKIPQNYLHIWPRQEFMLIGLPNPDCTFTCTLFAPFAGEFGFDALDPKDHNHPTREEIQRIQDYFEKFFEGIPALIPNYIEQFLENPTSPLMQVSLNPWNYKDKVCVIGDAAHAIVPFYGQGMNCAFEDCLMLYELLNEHGGDTSKVFPLFSSLRRPAATALRDLSIQNYVEMRSLTAKPWFVIKKIFENHFHKWFPSLWMPIYQMVSFTRIPYHSATRRAKVQDRVAAGILLLMTIFILLRIKRTINRYFS